MNRVKPSKSKNLKVPYVHTETVHNFNAAREVLPFIISRLKPLSLLDVGCGTGTWLKIARELGVDELVGVDGDFIDRSLLKISESEFLERDLRNEFDLGRKFDLVICLEVAEHLPEDSAEGFINSICKHGDIVLFSAAIPYQGGQNHLNEQWPQYWAELFKKNGFNFFDAIRPAFWNHEKVDFWYRQNTIIFSKHNIQITFPTVDKSELLSLIHPSMWQYKQWEMDQLKLRIRQLERPIGVKESFKKLITAILLKIGNKA